MPLLNEANRFMIDTLKARINEVVFGFGGTLATQDDTDVTALARYTYDSITKTNDNEIVFSAIIEVNS